MFNSGFLLTLFIAATLAFFVAPHLALVSGKAARAMRLAAGVLALGPVLDLFAPGLLRLLAQAGVPLGSTQAFHALAQTLFWGCLAWSVVSVVQSAPPKGVL